MKKYTVVTLVVAALLLGGLVLNDSIAQPRNARKPISKRVAVCNVYTIYQNYEKAKDNLTKLNQQKKTIQAEVQNRMKKAQEIADTLKSGLIKKGSKAYEQQVSEMMRIQLETQAWEKLQTQLAMRRHQAMTREMDDEIMAAVSKVAAEHGVDLVMTPDATADEEEADVLQRISRRTILYWSDRVDMTDAVLTRLNNTYKNSK
jgi:Skp family chaperone for outer membrane proteins